MLPFLLLRRDEEDEGGDKDGDNESGCILLINLVHTLDLTLGLLFAMTVPYNLMILSDLPFLLLRRDEEDEGGDKDGDNESGCILRIFSES
jgi:hypothetical protein